MTMKRRGLGRNLDALLGGTRAATEQAVPVNTTATVDQNGLTMLAIDTIEPGQYQPRQQFSQNSLQELADSIQTQGVISPITVRNSSQPGRYELIAGERRWRAAQLAGLSAIPALVKELDDQNALAIALIENIQREDLNPMEEANALCRLAREFDLTHQQVADAVGKSRSTVSNLLRLTELHSDVKHLLEQGALEMGHARALLVLDGGKEQLAAAQTVINNQLTVRKTEQLVKQLLTPKRQLKRLNTSADVDSLARELSDTLTAPVKIQHSNTTGKGKLVLHYHSLAELQGLVERIKK